MNDQKRCDDLIDIGERGIAVVKRRVRAGVHFEIETAFVNTLVEGHVLFGPPPSAGSGIERGGGGRQIARPRQGGRSSEAIGLGDERIDGEATVAVPENPGACPRFIFGEWWARDDSNIRPLLYQSSALTS